MFEITFSGSWPNRIRPVTAKVSGWYAVPFLLYIALVVFAVIKIVTALFLKETLHSAANDADMMLEDSERVSKSYQNKIEGLFRLADNDGDGLLTLQEFMETMNLQSVQHYLKILDVTVTDSRILFEILDDGDGLVTITEFCQGISKLRGHANKLVDQQADEPAVEQSDHDDGSHNGERSKNLLRSQSLRNTKFSSAYVMSEITEPDPPVKSFVKGPLDLVMGFIVVVNLSMMAAATQATGHLADVALNLASGAPWGLTEQGFETAELVFYFIYITDVVVRILVLRSEWYFDRREGWMYMNFFDLLLVSVHTFEILLLPVCLGRFQAQGSAIVEPMFSFEIF
eukprot:Skav215348  [mRNA]  locus=scaffold1391:406314:411966:- [translate_table: standard]